MKKHINSIKNLKTINIKRKRCINTNKYHSKYQYYLKQNIINNYWKHINEHYLTDINITANSQGIPYAA